jgi:hypothetical protein
MGKNPALQISGDLFFNRPGSAEIYIFNLSARNTDEMMMVPGIPAVIIEELAAWMNNLRDNALLR